MADQRALPLINGLQSTLTSAGNRLMEEIRLVVTLNIPKRVILAEQIGIKEGHLTDALHRNGKHFAAQWLPHVCLHDREHKIASLIAGWQSCRIIEKQPLTDAEYRACLEAALRRAGAVGEALRVDAFKHREVEEEP